MKLTAKKNEFNLWKETIIRFWSSSTEGGRFKKQIKAKRLHVIFKCHNVSDERAVRYMDVLVNLVRGVHSGP